MVNLNEKELTKEELLEEEFSNTPIEEFVGIEENEEIKNIKTPNCVIEIKDLYKSYGKKDVLRGLNLNIKKGEVFGFIGKNGVGKSTTIDCMVGLKEADSGDIILNGYDILTQPIEAKTQFGYVPSEPVTYEMMSGNEYLQFVASAYNMIQTSFENNYNFLLKKLGMSPSDMNRKIREYSHGMQQKVCLMASLIHNPKIWILDEPTVGLDIMVYEVLLKMIKDYASNGKTVFITSHNIDLVARVCDRVAIINDGKVSELIDFNEEPTKRRDLSRIFFKTYKEEGMK